MKDIQSQKSKETQENKKKIEKKVRVQIVDDIDSKGFRAKSQTTQQSEVISSFKN